MTSSIVNRNWAVRVPVGYRVGDWEITAPIATGNFGSVYAAKLADNDTADNDTADDETADDETVAALKFIAVGPMGPRQFRDLQELAQREVEFSRHTEHEHLVRVSETLVVQDTDAELSGAIVLVMERADKSLQDLLDANASAQPLPDAGRLITQICAGLRYLHDSSWVHGDLKPSNILIMPDGSVRLADFGLVTRLDGTHGYGLPLGSTDYTPPERSNDQLGERGVVIRPSADIWALGVTAFQILTGGSFPIPGSTPGARAAGAQEYAAGRAPLRLPADIDPGWRTFVTRCLAHDHADRPSANDLLELATELADQGRPARSRHRRWTRPAVLVPTALVTAATVAGAAWWVLDNHPGGTGHTGQPRMQLTVYNAETACRDNPERLYTCSMGLALDPHKPYAAGNTAKRRVWHGDKLITDCALYDGERVADETGVGSTTWYRVAVDGEATGHAWLPAVRTHDNATKLPTCPP